MHERENNAKGLFSSDGSFRTDEQIKRELALNGELPFYHTPVKSPLSADEYLALAEQQARQRLEASPLSENFVEVTLPHDSIICTWGDLHLFNDYTHHDRVRQELEAITNTPNVYVILGADLVDGIHWGGESGGEQTNSLTHQHQAMHQILRSLRGRVVVGVSGEHDSKWASKTGPDPYAPFSEETGAPYVRGVGEILIHCGDYDYKMVVQHKPRGHSMYNKNHSTFREARFELQDADVYVNFHTHQKQLSQETIRKFGRADMVTHISSGAYKPQDGYGQREGYVNQVSQQMYGAAMRLHGDKKKVGISWDILDAIRKWR